MANQVWVVPHQGKWAVRSAGGRVLSLHRTQAAAATAARRRARARRSELVVQGRDGRIRRKDSFGPDPFPPRG